jgi:phage gp29-like protein
LIPGKPGAAFGPSEALIQKWKTGFDPMKDAVSWDDFPELALTFYNYFPDPDQVLLKLGQNSGVYREMLVDSHIGGSLLQRKSKTKQRSIVFLPGDETPQAEAARVLCESQIMAIPRLRNVVSEILNAPFFGASYLELYFDRLPPEGDKRPAGEIVLKDIKEKPFEWFAYDKDGTLGIKDQLSATFTIRPLPSWKFVAVIYDGSYANPYGDRVCKRVYWPWIFKKGGFRFWAEFIEKYGMPFLFGKLPPKASDEDVASFHEDLYNMVRNGVVVARTEPDGTKIDVIETTGRASSADAYLRYKNALNIEISKAILGETLTIENSETGSQAATEIHKEMLKDIQDEDRVLVEWALSEIARRITSYNFPPEVPSPFPSVVGGG